MALTIKSDTEPVDEQNSRRSRARLAKRRTRIMSKEQYEAMPDMPMPDVESEE